MRRKISQREARRTAKQLKELQHVNGLLLRRYSGHFPGTHIFQKIQLTQSAVDVLDTAVRLGYGLAAKLNVNTLDIYAVK